jgi:hypothetical protein
MPRPTRRAENRKPPHAGKAKLHEEELYEKEYFCIPAGRYFALLGRAVPCDDPNL